MVDGYSPACWRTCPTVRRRNSTVLCEPTIRFFSNSNAVHEKRASPVEFSVSEHLFKAVFTFKFCVEAKGVTNRIIASNF
jgi:hypothetical protein